MIKHRPRKRQKWVKVTKCKISAKEFRYKYPFGLLNIIDLAGGERHTK